jgi:hypothetical protein
MEHDSVQGEKVAGIFHLVLAVAYIFATIWHVKSTLEHFSRLEE